MYVSLSDKSLWASNNIGVLLTKDKIKYKTIEIIPLKPTIASVGNKIIQDKENWVEIKHWFKAKGGEKYLTIGNFLTDEETKLIPVKKVRKYDKKKGSYYYIDNVSLYEITDTTECSCYKQLAEIKKDSLPVKSFDNTKIEQGNAIILNNVYFETAKSELLPKSFSELDKLVDYLLQNKNTKIEISGHTDNVGNEKDNLLLSKARAKAVADYLIKHRISEERIRYIGYGSSKPISDNLTEEGKAKNRRVEFKIISSEN